MRCSWGSYIFAVTTWMLTTKFIRHFSEGSLEFIKNYDVFFVSQIGKKKVTHIEKSSTGKSYFSSFFYLFGPVEKRSPLKKIAVGWFIYPYDRIIKNESLSHIIHKSQSQVN